MTKITEKGNRVVLISGRPGFFSANLYVNTRNGIDNADITTARWSGRTLRGAERWAARMLS